MCGESVLGESGKDGEEREREREGEGGIGMRKGWKCVSKCAIQQK